MFRKPRKGQITMKYLLLSLISIVLLSCGLSAHQIDSQTATAVTAPIPDDPYTYTVRDENDNVVTGTMYHGQTYTVTVGGGTVNGDCDIDLDDWQGNTEPMSSYGHHFDANGEVTITFAVPGNGDWGVAMHIVANGDIDDIDVGASWIVASL